MRLRRAYLFDRVPGAEPASTAGMNARVAACYAWAEAHDLVIVDEIIAWSDGERSAAELLAEASALCRREGAALLVHSAEVLPDGVPAGQGGLVVLVVDGPSPVGAAEREGPTVPHQGGGDRLG